MSRSLPLIEPLESRYAPATLSIAPVSEFEGTGGTKIFNFKVTLSEAVSTPVSVAYATGDGTATTADNDYTAKAGFLTFNPAANGAQPVLEQNISIVVASDNKLETDETFIVSLLNASGATIAVDEATGTIQNDDTAPKISIGNASISEGNIAIGSPGTPQRMTFTVSLSNASYLPVSVTVSTVDDTASSVDNADFVAKTETLTFNPGQTSKTFVVDLNGDVIGEVNEKFTVELSDPVNGTLSDNQKVGTGTIINDDPTLRVTDVRVAEGNPAASGSPGTTDMIFTVVLDRAGKNDLVTVDYATAEGTATPGVDGAGDYTAQGGTLTFQPGETTKQIIVKINKDSVLENDETVLLNLSNASNAYVDDPQVVGTIANDEIVASLTVNGGTQLRMKENEFTSQVDFTMTLSQASTDAAGVDVSVLFGGSATKGEDYSIVGGDLSSIHFSPGETTKDFFVTITNDDLASLDEVLQVSLSGATNAVVAGGTSQTTVTIENDDGQAFLMISDATPVTEGPTAKAFLTVSLSKGVEGAASFNYSTVSGTAISGSDFTFVSKTGTIDAGQMSTQIEVPILNDNLNEKDEKFTVQLSNGTGGATTIGGTADPTGEVTIVDDDPKPTLSFESTEILQIVEGDSGTKIATFKLKLDTISGREVTVRAQTVDGTATAGQDYVAFDQIVKIPAGQTQATFSVVLNGDTADEIDENFLVQLSEVDGATIATGNEQVETKILNNDRQIFIDDVTVSEGAGQASFAVRLNAPSLHPVTVTFKTSNGTAIGGDGTGVDDDYISKEIVLTFAPGEVAKNVTVDLVGDTSAESIETFFGELTNPGNAVIAVPKATATITNDDPGFRISDARLVEGGPGATTMMAFTVTREGPTSGEVSVNFATENGTAVEGSDYTRTVGTLTFGDGSSEKTILVPILGDSTPEGASENFSVKLSNPSVGVSLIDDTGVGTIIDNEAAVVTITDEQVVEGDSGTKQMIFVVTVTGTVSGTVLLDYTTVAGTATTADFTNTTGTLNFTSAGSQSIIVPIVGDLISEGDQTFTVKLTPDSSSSTVNLADDTGVGTIQDNEAAPAISIVGGKVIEGNSGLTEVRYTINLDRPSDNEVTVDFFTQNGTADAGIDYNAVSTSKVTFLPGQTEVNVFVQVIGDTILEPDQTIIGHLANPTNASIGTATSAATIQNDEILVTIADGSRIENGGDGTMTVNLSSGASTVPITVSFAVSDGTAILGTDFVVKNNIVSVTFDPGETSKDIVFTMTDDTKFEGDETFTVKLTDATNATIGAADTGTFTIIENEQVFISVSDQFVFEGETAVVIGTPTSPGKLGTSFPNPPPDPTTKNVQFTISLSGPSERPITVNASSFLEAGDSAVAGTDFVAFTDTQVTFAPGEISKTITVGIIDDSADEPVESFQIKLSNATLGTIAADDTGTIRIVDNDLRGISIGDASVVEGPAGAGGERMMSFTITLAAAATQTVSVDASTLSSSATADVDFIAKTETITFNPGDTSKTFVVTINGDDTPEGDESFAVLLTNPNGTIITDDQATGRIVTDEVRYEVTPTVTTINENAATKTVTFTVTRSGDASLLNTAGSVTFTTVDGTAKAGANADYLAQSGVLQFAPNETSKTITITINNDGAFEADENFLLRLTGSTGGALADGNHTIQDTLESTVTIQSDDAAPTLSIADVRKSEGNSGTTTFQFVVSLSAANEQDVVTVNFSTEDGTAISGVNPALQDFVSQTAGTLTFAKGETSKTISVVVNGDIRDEADEETFTVRLTKEAGNPIVISDDVAIGTIVDDDATPKLTFDGANNGNITVIEGNDGVTTVKLKLKLSGPSEKPIAINASLVPGGTATQGSDFEVVTDLSQTITFAAGDTEKEIEFRILPDQVDELNETFSVKVEATDATKNNVIIQDAGATVTITDDDAAPKITINDVSIVEGNSGKSNLSFTVSIDGMSDRDITVDFATLDGTAIAGGVLPDYVAQMGKLTFAAGSTDSKTIEIEVNGDQYKESNETFQVKLSNATNDATITRDTGTGTIVQDDDTKVTLMITDAKVTEGDSGTKQAVFTVQLSAATSADTTFTAFTQNGTAVSGSDYTAVDQKFTIPAGSTSVTIPVTITGDKTFEFTESFFVSVAGVSDAATVDVLDGEGRGTIYNDDIDFADPQKVRYVDPDGDLVTIKITKGILFSGDKSILTFEESGSTGGRVLAAIDFTGNPSLYNGTSLFVTADTQPGFFESGGVSDGKANVGFIQGALVDSNLLQFARGIDFTNVVIDGDLGGMTAGDLFVSPSIRGVLFADSIGTKGTETLPGSLTDNFCYFLSKVNSIRTNGDVSATIQTFGGIFGDIGSVQIGGALRGVNDHQPGRIVFTGTLNKAIVGSIIGGAGQGSGAISGAASTNASIGSVRVIDALIGGAGKESGSINARSINFVDIGVNPDAEKSGIIGGSGENSGSIIAPKLGNVIVGSGVRDVGIQGGAGLGSGLISTQGSMGNVTVYGDIVGGSGGNSAQVFAGKSIQSVRVFGSLVGGAGTTSGAVFASDNLNSFFVAENISGGVGSQSGIAHAGGSMKSLVIGTERTATAGDGDLAGGSGQSSGLVDIDGALSKAVIFGDLRGGTGSTSGALQIDGAIGSLTIHGNFQGGDSNAATVDTAPTSATQTGFITAERIARMTIDGSWISGANNGSGLADSGAIRVATDIGSLTVGHDILGNSNSRVVLAAGGTGSNHIAIGDLNVKGKAEYLDVLGGYFTGATLTSPLGKLVNADAIIRSVTVGGDILATNIISGIAPGADGRFGTPDDVIGSGTGVTNNASLLAIIAKVTLKGSVGQTTDAYGIVAQLVTKVIVGTETVPGLSKGESNDKYDEDGVGATDPIGGNQNFRVVEV
jgi:hypothetical protein